MLAHNDRTRRNRKVTHTAQSGKVRCDYSSPINMSVRNRMFIIHKGRIFVFLCVQLYITSVSPLPLIERGSILYHNDGNDSTSVDALRRNHVKFISVHDSFHRIPTPVKTPSRRENNRIEVLQEVKVTHKLNNIGKHSGYRKSNAGQDRIFHANSNNDKVTVDVKNPSDNTDSRIVDSWGSEIALAQQESLQPGADDTVHPTNPSSMVLTIASILVGLFGMSVLVAIFQCCCKKKRNDDSVGDKEEKDVKQEKTDDKVDDRRSPSTKDEGDGNDLTQKEVAETSQETKPQNDEAASFKNRIKAFEKTKTPEPSPVSKGPTPKRRPQSEAFKAFESKGIIMGMGRSPLLPRKKTGNEDENRNETGEDQEPEESSEERRSEGLKLPEGLGVQMRKTPSDKKTDKEKSKADTGVTDDDMAGYKQPENPDVVIADVDDEDTEFGAIKRETEVLRSYRKAPPPKNRNRSSAAFRRKRAQESMADLLIPENLDDINEEKEDSPLLTKDKSEKTKSNSSEKIISKDTKTEKKAITVAKDSKSGSTSSIKSQEHEKSPKRKSPEKSMQTKERTPEKVNGTKQETVTKKIETDSTETSTSANNDNKSRPSEPLFPPGGNIFLQIDPTVKKKSPEVFQKSHKSFGGSQPDIRVGSGSRNDIGKVSPLTPDKSLVQALSEKLKTQHLGSDLEQNKLFKRRSLNTDL